MATARFVQDGDSVPYTPDSNVSAGDVIVLEDCIRIAKVDITANELGALAMGGVFEVPKIGGSAGEILVDGQDVYWDESAEVVTDEDSGNKYFGKVVGDPDDDAVLCNVQLIQSWK